jgi:ABC-type uncharacterized transport system
MDRLVDTRQRLFNLLYYALLFTSAGLAAWASLRYSYEFDWTAGGRNTLSQESQELLQQIEEPIRFVAYASNSNDLRNKIRVAIERFQRFKPDLDLKFVNPAEEPDTVRELGIRVDGETILSYQGRSENLRELSESTIANALFRLAHAEQRWIVFLAGHGERSPSGDANHDLGHFGQQLRNKGFRILELKTAETGTIPDNTSLLVIADPSVDLSSAEADAVLHYMNNGGDLFWLQDSERLNGLEGLGGLLGIHFLPGTIVDAGSRAYGINNPAMITVSSYPAHPITHHIQSASLFPKAAAIESNPGSLFRHELVLTTSAQSWSERGPIKRHIQFNPDQGETQGPLKLGLALSRTLEGAEQRIVIIGDGDFLSNTYLGNGVNLDLGLNMIQWLTDTGNAISIPVRFHPDHSLALDPWQFAAQGLVFLILIPSVLIISGWTINRRRKCR